jgi:hypothetical protein
VRKWFFISSFILICSASLISIRCSKDNSPTQKKDYFGLLRYPDATYKLVVRLDDEPRVYLIGIRPNELPVTFSNISKDSIRFSRTDMVTTFIGAFDSKSKQYAGSWRDDQGEYPLILLPVNVDTVAGFFPRTNREWKYNVPVRLKDNIEVCAITDQDIDQEKLRSMMMSVMDEKYGYIHSLLISRNNCLVLEEYFYNFNREVTFGIQSVTKSFVSALVGKALDKGEIGSPEEELCSYLPKYKELACNEQNKTITIRDAMTMHTGLEWQETEYDYGDEQNDLDIAYNNEAFEYLFQQPRSEKKFAYNSLNHALMNMVLKHSTKMENADEMRDRLLDPLAITSYDLGSPDEYGILGDIFMTTRDLLKFGNVYLNNGEYNGKQIIPAAWVRESTTPQVRAGNNTGYGYFWWTTEFQWRDQKVHTFFAWGYGGQYIFVVPDLKLVVAMNGTNWSTDPEKYVFELMQHHIIPSCN